MLFRSADGYHLIDALMTTLELHDTLTIVDDPDGRVEYTGRWAAGLDGDGDDLVSRALRAGGRRAAVRVDKAIPHGGGLGGGSADAAAVLRWCGCHDLDVAARIGADVPFCLVGGRARVRGIGEIVEPIDRDPGLVTLVVPPFSVGTPNVYRAWDALGGPTDVGDNDLEPAAIAVEPRLAEWKRRIEAASGVRPVLAGSGSTWFLPGDHGDIATELPDATVIVTGHA